MKKNEAALFTVLFLALGSSFLPAAPAPAEVAGAPGPAAADAAVDQAVPEAVRTGIEAALREKVRALVDARNEEGNPYQRGSFSKHFRKIDDTTYTASFSRDTAKKDDSLLTERFVLTLKKDAAADKWKVTNEELKDTYTGLFRGPVTDGEVYKFDGFAFSREGMSIKGGKGFLQKRLLQGKPVAIVVVPEGLSYDYAAPVKFAAALYEVLKKERATDVLFTPDYSEIACDPSSCEEILSSAFAGLRPSSMSEASPLLHELCTDAADDFRKNIKESGFYGFQTPYDQDRRYWKVDLRKKSPDRRVGVEYDSFEPKEVSYWAWSLDKIGRPDYVKVYAYYSEASRDAVQKGRAQYYELEKRDDPEARYYDLTGLKGTVEVGIEDAELLTADVTFTIQSKREIRELPFFIVQTRRSEEERKASKNPQLTINSIEDGEGHEMMWVKTGPVSGIVVLPEKKPAGSVITVRMQFENKAAIYKFTPTFSYVSRFGWLPFVRFTDMIHDFDLTIKAPAKFEVLGIGRMVSEEVKDDVRITRWIADSPVEFPSITFGDYLTRQSKVEVKKDDGTIVPVKIHVDKIGKMASATKTMEDLADQAANSLIFYRQVYGVDYPYGKLDLVNDPLGAFYGQSPSSLVYLGNGVFIGQGQAGDYGGSRLAKFNRDVVAHEVAHQWWGSLIPNYNNGNYWFVESLAEYSAALYMEATEGPEGYKGKIDDWRRTILDADLQCSVQDASILWTGDLFRGYTAAVYNKGPYMFHIMRSTWGLEKFKLFLQTLAKDLKGKAIVTRDIQKIAEKVFGGNMDFFFDQWIRGAGLPKYTFTYKTRETEDGKYLVEGKVTQQIVVGRKAEPLGNEGFRAVVPITILLKSGKEYQYKLLVDGPETKFQFKVGEEPRSVVFNKYGEVLAYDVKTN